MPRWRRRCGPCRRRWCPRRTWSCRWTGGAWTRRASRPMRSWPESSATHSARCYRSSGGAKSCKLLATILERSCARQPAPSPYPYPGKAPVSRRHHEGYQMSKHHAVLLVTMLALTPRAHAQTGSGSSCCEEMTPRVRAGIMTASQGTGLGKHEWLQGVVMWRGANPIGGAYSSETASIAARAMRDAQSASQDAGRSSVGGVFANAYYYAELSQDRKTLWVLGE